jgi:hypothetical protein
MGLTADIATAIAATVAGASGMRGCASADLDTIPGTPYGAVGLPKVRVDQGAWERVTYTWPVRLFVARVSDGPRTTVAVYDLIDAVVVAFRTGISGGLSASGVLETLIETGDADKFYDVGGETYQALDMTVTTTVGRSTTYTA